MNKVLFNICKHCVSLIDGWHPYPSTCLSKKCNITLYQTRKELKKLKELGLIKSDIQTITDDEGTCILRGYTITEKAKETEEYKKAFEEERKICLQIFDIDIGRG